MASEIKIYQSFFTKKFRRPLCSIWKKIATDGFSILCVVTKQSPQGMNEVLLACAGRGSSTKLDSFLNLIFTYA